jgi:hypothetical protein
MFSSQNQIDFDETITYVPNPPIKPNHLSMTAKIDQCDLCQRDIQLSFNKLHYLETVNFKHRYFY